MGYVDEMRGKIDWLRLHGRWQAADALQAYCDASAECARYQDLAYEAHAKAVRAHDRYEAYNALPAHPTGAAEGAPLIE